jgi:hypothetical protein
MVIDSFQSNCSIDAVHDLSMQMSYCCILNVFII